MNTHFRASDFDPPNRWNGPFVFLIGALAICLIAAWSFYLGVEWQIALQKEAQRVEAAKPKRVQPVTNPLTQWSCLPQEFREHAHACAARWRAGRIGG